MPPTLTQPRAGVPAPPGSPNVPDAPKPPPGPEEPLEPGFPSPDRERVGEGEDDSDV